MYLDVLGMQAQCKYYEDVYMCNKGLVKTKCLNQGK